MADTLEKELHEYFLQLSEAEKKSVLQMIKTFISGRRQSFERISIEQYNRELEESEREIEEGHYTSQQDLEKEIGKW